MSINTIGPLGRIAFFVGYITNCGWIMIFTGIKVKENSKLQ